MAIDSQLPSETPRDPEKNPSEGPSFADWFMLVFIPRYGKIAVGVVTALLIIGVASVLWAKSRKEKAVEENKALGRAYIYFAEEKLDSARAVLSAFVQSEHGALVQSKAHLMLGKIHYLQGRYDEAIGAYSKVEAGGEDHALIGSGALHGMAASYMEKKDYIKAIEKLEEFISDYMRTPLKPAERIEAEDRADLSPVVPNALWKLVLCYRATNNMDKLKQTADKLQKAYPESREAMDAQRLLAQI